MGRDQLRDGVGCQRVEYARIAEEAGNVDQQVARQCLQLGLVDPEDGDVARKILRLQPGQSEPPADTALQGARLVEAEIVCRRRPQHLDDGRQAILEGIFETSGAHPTGLGIAGLRIGGLGIKRWAAGRLRGKLLGRRRQAGRQCGRDLGDRQDKIRKSRPDRTLGHAVVTCLCRLLHGHHAAF